MAQDLDFSPGPVQNITLNVYVNGVLRPHYKVSWGGDTTGGLPDQAVSAGTGMRSRTGIVHWAGPAVETTSPHPIRRINGWPPREGDSIVIEAVGAFGTSRRFTGRLGRVSGSFTDGTLTSKITDRIADHLSTPITIDPMLTGARGQSYRIAWEAIERAGLGLLTEAEGDGDTILHTTPQGDTWSTIGGDADASSASRHDDPFGIETWTNLRSDCLGIGRGGRGVMFIGRGGTVGVPSMSVRMDDGIEFTLTHNRPNNMLQLRQDGVLIREESYQGDTEAPVILAFALSGTLVRLWVSRTEKVDFFIDAVLSWPEEVWGDRLAAAHVRYVASLTEGAEMLERTLEYPASMLRTTLATERLPATRGFENTTARQVVESWAESTLSSFWMDEHGRTHLAARDRLKSRPTDRFVRMDERVFSGSWSIGDDGVYSSVVAKGERGIVRSSGSRYRITIHEETQARGFEEDATEERFVEAAPEIDWGPIDLTSYPAERWWDTDDNPLEGTWHGVVVTQRDQGIDEYWPSIYGVTHSLLIERLGQRTLKLTETIGGIPAGEAVYCRIPPDPETTAIDRAFLGRATPFIRAQWLSEWIDYTARAGGGPSYAPTLKIDIGWWNTPADAQKIADALADEVATPAATFSDTATLWDPRRQIGDVENWWAVDDEGDDTWMAQVLIVGYSEKWDGDVPSQSVSTRVIHMVDPSSGQAYTDMEAAYADYNELNDYSATYGDVYDALPDRYTGA